MRCFYHFSRFILTPFGPKDFDDVVNILQLDGTGKNVSVRTVRFGKSFLT